MKWFDLIHPIVSGIRTPSHQIYMFMLNQCYQRAYSNYRRNCNMSKIADMIVKMLLAFLEHEEIP